MEETYAGRNGEFHKAATHQQAGGRRAALLSELAVINSIRDNQKPQRYTMESTVAELTGRAVRHHDKGVLHQCAEQIKLVFVTWEGTIKVDS